MNLKYHSLNLVAALILLFFNPVINYKQFIKISNLSSWGLCPPLHFTPVFEELQTINYTPLPVNDVLLQWKFPHRRCVIYNDVYNLNYDQHWSLHILSLMSPRTPVPCRGPPPRTWLASGTCCSSPSTTSPWSLTSCSRSRTTTGGS